jgi:hypothetical protein
MRGQTGEGAGGEQAVKIVLFIIVVVSIIYIVLVAFFKAPSMGEMMGEVLKVGVQLVFKGIYNMSKSLTTLG